MEPVPRLPLVEPGQTWKHHSGRMYQVLFLTNTENPSPKFPVAVVYQSVVNRNRWSRPLSEWHDKFELVYDAETSEIPGSSR